MDSKLRTILAFAVGIVIGATMLGAAFAMPVVFHAVAARPGAVSNDTVGRMGAGQGMMGRAPLGQGQGPGSMGRGQAPQAGDQGVGCPNGAVPNADGTCPNGMPGRGGSSGCGGTCPDDGGQGCVGATTLGDCSGCSEAPGTQS